MRRRVEDVPQIPEVGDEAWSRSSCAASEPLCQSAWVVAPEVAGSSIGIPPQRPPRIISFPCPTLAKANPLPHSTSPAMNMPSSMSKLSKLSLAFDFIQGSSVGYHSVNILLVQTR